MDGDLLVPPDAEGPDGVPGLGEDGLLAGEGLQHLGRAGQPVAGLAHADVEAQLADAHLPHGVLGLALGHHLKRAKRGCSWYRTMGKDTKKAKELIQT